MSKILNKWNKLHALQKIYVVLWFLFLVFLIVWVFVTAFGFPDYAKPTDPTTTIKVPVMPERVVDGKETSLSEYQNQYSNYLEQMDKFNAAVASMKASAQYAAYNELLQTYNANMAVKANTIAALALVDTLILFGALILTVITNGFVLKGKGLFKNAYKKGGAL